MTDIIEKAAKDKYSIFESVVNLASGIKTLEKPFNDSFPIVKIKAVFFDEDYDFTKEWNDYVDTVNNKIDAERYVVRLFLNGKTNGLMVFYRKDNSEVKTKHIDWTDFYNWFKTQK